MNQKAKELRKMFLKMRSKCCGTKVEVSTGKKKGEPVTTAWFICKKCRKPCDIKRGSQMKKIALIGSTQYQEKFLAWTKQLRKLGHKVRLPAWDDHRELNELEVCEYNRRLIEWADIVGLIWDSRSVGSVFDMGMVFALRKPLKILYLEKKTFTNVFRQYEEKSLTLDDIGEI